MEQAVFQIIITCLMAFLGSIAVVVFLFRSWG